MIAGKQNAPTAAQPSPQNAGPAFRVGDERLIKVLPGAAKRVSTLLTKQGRPSGVLRVAVIGVVLATLIESALLAGWGLIGVG